MHFVRAFRLPPLSRKERKRRDEIADAFIGKWILTSDLPFNGVLFIIKDGRTFRGSIEFREGLHRGEVDELSQIDASGDKIAFSILWKGINDENPIREKWLCFGQLKENAKQIEGKIYLYRFENRKPKKHAELNWSATKVELLS
jgi:hypothetical protein